MIAAFGSALGLGAVWLLRTADQPRETALALSLGGGAAVAATIFYAAGRLTERPDYQGRGAVGIRASFADVLRNKHGRLLFFVFAIPIVFLFWLMNRQMQGGGSNQAMNFGKSKARLASDGKRRVTFGNVAGADEAVEELNEIVDFLRDPRRAAARAGTLYLRVRRRPGEQPLLDR